MLVGSAGAVGTWQYKPRSDEGRTAGVYAGGEELGEEEPVKEVCKEHGRAWIEERWTFVGG